jgi:DNA (cytosine-5)-methyltransferase 1
MTIRDYVGDSWGIDYYYRHPRSYARRGIFSLDETSPTIRGVNRPVPKGYELHPGDPVQSLDGIRCLTTKERFVLQTFPEDFGFEGSKTNLEQMVGNAMPVKLAKFVGDAILDYVDNPNKYKTY